MKKKRHIYFYKKSNQSAFSLLELVTALAIISALTSISIPNIQKWVKISRIDEAKAKVNSAIADCLFSIREGKDVASTKPNEAIISDADLNTAGYKIRENADSCDEFYIEPVDNKDEYLYSIGFRSNNFGDITKVATAPSNKATKSSCDRWAGVNCGISAEQQARWDALAKIDADKKVCNDSFNEWLRNTPPNGGTGSKNRWRDGTALLEGDDGGCDLLTWAFEGIIQSGEAAYKEAEKAKLGEICVNNKQKKKDDKALEGPVTVESCGDNLYYFCDGNEYTTKVDFDSCVANNLEAKCKSDRLTALQNGYRGEYGPSEGPGECGQVVYMCNNVEYKERSKYLGMSECGMYDAVPSCGAKPYSFCGVEGWRDWGRCKAWCECVGLIP